MIGIDRRGVTIRGRREILLCASLFYFRVPAEMWADRMKKIHDAGYNCLDVYLPWNFHEIAPGHWDFTTRMRNVSEFLSLAAAEGLYVVARPGPYICSEWDGGGLPAWLSAERVSLRQNDPAFLSHVREWYERILPIIARFQLGASGSVILLQVENELDFFDCADPAGYLSALRDMALDQGIMVPLVTCAGQGDLERSWARVSDVVPTVNLYPDQLTPDLSAGIGAAERSLSELGYPLLVMETGRDACLLRRLLSYGAKLLGAYNQVGGYDFGFTTAVNNWGSPLSFQTSHYDFNSLVGSFGEVRESVWEHQALAGLLQTLGPAIAGALPCADHGIRVECLDAPVPMRFPVLRLFQEDKGGYAVAVHNAGDRPVCAKLSGAPLQLSGPATLRVGAGSSAFALIRLSLAPWGLPGVILFSSAEPYSVRAGSHPALVFQATAPAEVHIDLGAGTHVFRFDCSGVARVSIPIPGGGELELIGVHRSLARAALAQAKPEARRRPPQRGQPGLAWKLSAVDPASFLAAPAGAAPVASPYMEDNGAYRGYALYGAQINGSAGGALGILLHDAADVLSLYVGGSYLGTQVPGGGFAWFAFAQDAPAGASVVARAEIWGHSNFDDPRLPAIRIGSRRGFSQATLVKSKTPLYPWTAERPLPELAGFAGFGHPGGGLTARVPARFKSFCVVTALPSMDRFFLWADGAECASEVEVDGWFCGRLDRWHPVMDLSGFVQTGRESRISLAPQKWYAAESPGTFCFAQGVNLPQWKLSKAEETQLLACARAHDAAARPTRLPLRMSAGAVAWLSAVVQAPAHATDYALVMKGSDVKACIFLNDVLVGRVFLPSAVRPRMAGGRDDCAYLPSCWLKPGSTVRVLLEAVGKTGGSLDCITAEPAG